MMRSYLQLRTFSRIRMRGWELLYHGNSRAATLMEELHCIIVSLWTFQPTHVMFMQLLNCKLAYMCTSTGVPALLNLYSSGYGVNAFMVLNWWCTVCYRPTCRNRISLNQNSKIVLKCCTYFWYCASLSWLCSPSFCSSALRAFSCQKIRLKQKEIYCRKKCGDDLFQATAQRGRKGEDTYIKDFKGSKTHLQNMLDGSWKK